jgi:hypothetical protein
MWMSGGGIRTGQTLGETDELGFLPVTRPLPIHDIHATILHQLGLDHRRLSFHTQGRDLRLTDVAGELIPEGLADSFDFLRRQRFLQSQRTAMSGRNSSAPSEACSFRGESHSHFGFVHNVGRRAELCRQGNVRP